MKQFPLNLGALSAFATKDELSSMAFPFFSLKKGGEKQIWRFDDVRSGRHIEVLPSELGSATIWDKDVLIYLASLYRRALDRNMPISSSVKVMASDLLSSIRRGHGGKDYRELHHALDRLVGTRYKTNVPTGNVVEINNFSMLSEYKLMKTKHGRLAEVVIGVSPWFLRSVESGSILTINPGFYLLTSGIHRRTYELLRMHLGTKNSFEIGLNRLYEKCGSARQYRKFRGDMHRWLGSEPVSLLDLLVQLRGESIFVTPNKLDDRSTLERQSIKAVSAIPRKHPEINLPSNSTIILDKERGAAMSGKSVGNSIESVRDTPKVGRDQTEKRSENASKAGDILMRAGLFDKSKRKIEGKDEN